MLYNVSGSRLSCGNLKNKHQPDFTSNERRLVVATVENIRVYIENETKAVRTFRIGSNVFICGSVLGILLLSAYRESLPADASFMDFVNWCITFGVPRFPDLSRAFGTERPFKEALLLICWLLLAFVAFLRVIMIGWVCALGAVQRLIEKE